MKDSYYLTIIIPTFGRIIELKALLDSLKKFEPCFSFEVIVVDQNESGFLDEVINSCSFENLSHERVKFKGLAKAKNYGIKMAKGEWICFPDDDCLFLSDTLNNFLAISTLDKADIFFGRCIDKDGANSVINFRKEQYELTKTNMEGGFIEATAFVKNFIAKSYLFDENMGAGCFHGAEEGFDWLYRMLNENIVAHFSPDIKFYHPQVISVLNKGSKESLRRVFTYRCGFGYLCRKHKFVRKYLYRFLLVFFSIPIFLLFNRTKARYYLVELLGLISGVIIP